MIADCLSPSLDSTSLTVTASPFFPSSSPSFPSPLYPLPLYCRLLPLSLLTEYLSPLPHHPSPPSPSFSRSLPPTLSRLALSPQSRYRPHSRARQATPRRRHGSWFQDQQESCPWSRRCTSGCLSMIWSESPGRLKGVWGQCTRTDSYQCTRPNFMNRCARSFGFQSIYIVSFLLVLLVIKLHIGTSPDHTDVAAHQGSSRGPLCFSTSFPMTSSAFPIPLAPIGAHIFPLISISSFSTNSTNGPAASSGVTAPIFS